MHSNDTADVLYVHAHSDAATVVIALERFTLTSGGLTSELISTSSTNPLRHCLSFDKVTYDIYSNGYFYQARIFSYNFEVKYENVCFEHS